MSLTLLIYPKPNQCQPWGIGIAAHNAKQWAKQWAKQRPKQWPKQRAKRRAGLQGGSVSAPSSLSAK